MYIVWHWAERQQQRNEAMSSDKQHKEWCSSERYGGVTCDCDSCEKIVCAQTCHEAPRFDYVAQAHVTASDKFYGERVPFEHMKEVLAEAIEALKKLDRIKKALFYGRELVGVEPSEDHCNALPVWVGNNDAQGAAIIHGIIGAATEAGELLEALYASTIDGLVFDPVNMGEEVGDVFWYFALLAKACDFTFEESQRTNIAKLRMRYGEKFSEFDANNRNLKAERSILEHGEVFSKTA